MSLVLASIADGVAVITLNRPEKLNALSTALEQAALDAVTSPEVAASRVIVFAGAGPRAFSPGADTSEISSFNANDILEYYRGSGQLYEVVSSLPQTTIAAVHGYCLGAGFELALACDLRIACESTQFGLPEVGIGIVPSSGGLARIVRHIGTGRAKYLTLTGSRLAAERALAWGLVSEVVPSEAVATDSHPGISSAGAPHVLAAAINMGRSIAGKPYLAAQVASQIIDVVGESPHAANLLLERYAYAMLNQTDQ